MVVATPTAQLRLQAIQAASAMEALTDRTAALVRKRDELTRLNDKLRALETIAADRVDPIGVIAYLTQRLPDDSSLLSLDIQKAKITAVGHTSDSSALLQSLSSDPVLRDVRSPTAVTRLPGATKEAFTVEFLMNPPAQPPATAASGAVPSAGPASAAQGQQQLPAAVATGSTASSPQRPASKAAGSSPFVIGGTR
jgi:general secretion pathway protein L